jgi:hypothetical protein
MSWRGRFMLLLTLLSAEIACANDVDPLLESGDFELPGMVMPTLSQDSGFDGKCIRELADVLQHWPLRLTWGTST